MLKNIEHPNIIKCYLSFIEDEYLYIVMDYAEEGDLQTKIEKQKTTKRFFAEKDLWEMAWQMCWGLLHMHANDLIHRDFKAMNVLWKDKLLKIADLSESKTLNTTNYLKSKVVGTPLFLSPEIIKNENYDHRVDIWAFGWVMYHLAALEPPFSGSSMDILMKNIQFKTPKSLQGWFSVKLKEFIYKTLEKQKAKRPFITELFDMFPSSFQLSRDVDILNYNKLKMSEDVFQKKNAIDTGIYAIDTEFNAVKNRQLIKKNMQTFFPDQRIIVNTNEMNTITASFHNLSRKNAQKKLIHKHVVNKYIPDVENEYLSRGPKKNTRSCNISRVIKNQLEKVSTNIFIHRINMNIFMKHLTCPQISFRDP